MVRQPPWRLVALLSCTLSFVLSPCQSAPKPANRPTLRLSLRDVPRKRRRLLTRQFGRVLQRAYLAVSAQLERLGFRPLRRKRRLVGVLFYT
ncbi:MAG: hypothetical protein KC609_12695, partial [Myxococcales bacterium]|nr:hypothetical protein [Myxococcales bacterium]